jgi:HAE1 family hydrophobic/amphiphilic exporter-1
MTLDRPAPLALLFSCLMVAATLSFGGFRFGSPSDDARAFSVTTEYSGANAREIERVITMPIEDELSLVTGVGKISSVSEFGRSRIIVRAKRGYDLSSLRADIAESVERAGAAFPRAVQRPRVASSDASDRPVYVVSFSSKSLGDNELGEYAEETLKPRFERVPGAGDVEVGGRGVEEIVVRIDPEEAAQYGIDPFAVADLLQRQHARLPVGSVEKDRRLTPIFFDAGIRDLSGFRELALTTSTGGSVRLSRIAEATRRFRPADRISRIDGERRVVVSVEAGGGENVLALCDGLDKVTAEIAREGIPCEVIYSKGTEIMRGIRRILVSMAVSLVSLFVFIGLFMPEARSRAILSASVPLSAFLGVAALAALRVPVDANVISGIVIGSGLIIDNYLIIFDYLRADPSRSLRPIAMPLLAGTLTTLIVFFPVLSLNGLGQGVRTVSIAICLMLVVSQFLTFTFLPLPLRRASRSVSRKKPLVELSRIARPFFILTEAALRRPRPVRLAYLLVIVAVPFLLFFGEKEFTPIDGDGVLFARAEFPSGTTIGEVDRAIVPYARDFAEIPGVRLVESASSRGGAEFTITFDGDKIQQAELKARLESLAERSPKARFFFGLAQNTTELKVGFSLSGSDHAALRVLVREAGEAFARERWVEGVVYHFKEAPPSRVFRPDGRALASIGETPARVANVLKWSVQGPVAMKWIESSRERDVRVLSGEDARDPDSLGGIRVPKHGSSPIALSGIGSIVDGSECERLYRDNRQASVAFTVIAKRMGLDELENRIESVKKEIDLPAGYALIPEASLGETRKEYRSLLLVFLLATFLVYAVLSIDANGFLLPVLVISAIPFSAFFPLAFLRATGNPITVASLVGIVILSGASVNNYILVTESLQSDDDERPFPERIKAALAARFNPLFLSSGTSVIASLPILFSAKALSDFPSALALVIALGLLGSFLGSFLFLPAIAKTFVSRRKR